MAYRQDDGGAAEEGNGCRTEDTVKTAGTAAELLRARASRRANQAFVWSLVGLGWLSLVCVFPFIGMLSLALFRRAGPALLAIPLIPPVVISVQAVRDLRRLEPGLPNGGYAIAGLILSLSVLCVGASLEYMVYKGLPEGNVRGKVSRVRSDMRSLATAIEAYYVDHNVYPAWGIGARNPGGAESYNFRVASLHSRFEPPSHLPTFLLNGPGPDRAFQTLTTPSAYVSAYPSDPFLKLRGSTFVYWSVYPGDRHPSVESGRRTTPVGGVGWILVSPGPDREYEIAGNWDVYDPSIAQPSPRLLAGVNKDGRAFTYDPTNGIFSAGDIWRVKQ